MNKLIFILSLFICLNTFAQLSPFNFSNDLRLLNEADKKDFLLANYFYLEEETPELAEAYFRIKDNFEILRIKNKDLTFESIMIYKTELPLNLPLNTFLNYINSEEGISSFLKDNTPTDTDIKIITSGLSNLYNYDYLYLITEMTFYDYNGIDEFKRFGQIYTIKTNKAVYQININTVKKYNLNDIITGINN